MSAATDTTIAKPVMRAATIRVTVISGDDSRTTGSKASDSVFHSDNRLVRVMTATAIGISSGSQKMSPAIRRAASRGNRMSRQAASGGRASTTHVNTATAAYPMVPKEYSERERSQSNRSADVRRVATHRIGGKSSWTSQPTWGAINKAPTSIVTHDAADRK